MRKRVIIGNSFSISMSSGASKILAPESAHRRSLTIGNPTSNIIFVNWGQAATLTSGFPILPSTQPFTFNEDNVGNLITTSFNAVIATAGATVWIFETLWGETIEFYG